jgi:hypothetical protein
MTTPSVRRRGLAVTLAVAALAVAAAGCGTSTRTHQIITTLTPTPSGSPRSAALVKTGKSCQRRVGQTVLMREPGKRTRLAMVLKKVHTTTGRLNTYSTAHYPTYGYWVVVPIIIKSYGPGLLRVNPESFVLRAGGQTHTVYDGSGGFSGLSHVLDPTFLSTGDVDRGPLAFDSPATHGTFSWEPDGKLACTWTF